MVRNRNVQSGPASQQGGQVLLIVVLILIIALTVGLSTASRSISNLRLSEEEISSRKALSAAETGIERALTSKSSIAQGTFTNSNATYNATVTEVKQVDTFCLFACNIVSQDEGVTLWLSDYSDDPTKIYLNPWSGSLDVYWGDNALSECGDAALELMVLEGPRSAPTITRYAFDACDARRGQNNFSSDNDASGGGNRVIEGRRLPHVTSHIDADNALLIRIIPVYNDTYVGVSSSRVFPSQGFKVNSTGTAGDTKKALTVFEPYPQLPAGFFSHSLFSPYSP